MSGERIAALLHPSLAEKSQRPVCDPEEGSSASATYQSVRLRKLCRMLRPWRQYLSDHDDYCSGPVRDC